MKSLAWSLLADLSWLLRRLVRWEQIYAKLPDFKHLKKKVIPGHKAPWAIQSVDLCRLMRALRLASKPLAKSPFLRAMASASVPTWDRHYVNGQQTGHVWAAETHLGVSWCIWKQGEPQNSGNFGKMRCSIIKFGGVYFQTNPFGICWYHLGLHYGSTIALQGRWSNMTNFCIHGAPHVWPRPMFNWNICRK